MIADVVDSTNLGDALIGVAIFSGFVAQQWQARKRAEDVKHKAEETAATVAATTEAAAAEVAGRVESVRDEQQRSLEVIKVLVNSRMDKLLEELQAERDRSHALEQKLGLAAGAEIPESQILTGPRPEERAPNDIAGKGE